MRDQNLCILTVFSHSFRLSVRPLTHSFIHSFVHTWYSCQLNRTHSYAQILGINDHVYDLFIHISHSPGMWVYVTARLICDYWSCVTHSYNNSSRATAEFVFVCVCQYTFTSIPFRLRAVSGKFTSTYSVFKMSHKWFHVVAVVIVSSGVTVLNSIENLFDSCYSQLCKYMKNNSRSLALMVSESE